MRTILFVCTGNTCRSPMAEAIARDAVERGLLGPDADVFIASAGLGTSQGQPPAAEAIQALRRMGIEHRGSSKPLSGEMIRKADLVFCMTETHAESARALVNHDPQQTAKIVVLDPEGDIEDPMGLGQSAYDSVARKLAGVIPRRFREMLTHEDRARL